MFLRNKFGQSYDMHPNSFISVIQTTKSFEGQCPIHILPSLTSLDENNKTVFKSGRPLPKK